MASITHSPPITSSKRPPWANWFRGETLVAWIFILPSLIGFITFFAIPAVRGVQISFTNWNLLRDPTPVGIANYTFLLQNNEFWNALRVTVYYVLLNIPIQTVFAILIAVMMDRLTQSMVIRGLLIIPWLMPNVVVGLLWLWLMDPSIGIINVALLEMGFSRIPFLTSIDWAMPSIAWINIWRHMGYTALLVFAGLQAIPRSVYEAAAIDGASEVRTFLRITLPLLRPVLVFVLVTSVIGSFQIFDTIAITTKGGPVNATKVINWIIYEQAFERLQMGRATAISVMLFFILLMVSLVQMRIMRADESDM
jgi:multiple sugar transport system permease protein